MPWGDNHLTDIINTHNPTQPLTLILEHENEMLKKIALEISDEDALKLEKLADQQTLTRDQLVNKIVQDLLHETQPPNS